MDGHTYVPGTLPRSSNPGKIPPGEKDVYGIALGPHNEPSGRARGDVEGSEGGSVSAPRAEGDSPSVEKRKRVVDVQALAGWGALPFIADGASGLSKRLLLLAPHYPGIHQKISPRTGPTKWKLESRTASIRDRTTPLISEVEAPAHSSTFCFFLQMLQRCTLSPSCTV